MIIYHLENLPQAMIDSAATNRAAFRTVLEETFNTAIASDVFMSFNEKIKSLLDTLSIPISDDQSYNQFFIHATKDLEGEVCRDAAKKGIIPVLPTNEQIHIEAKKRYDEKAVKVKRQADKKAAKDALNAKPIMPAAQVATG